MSDELMDRLKALRTRLHEEDSPGNVRVRWHPDGFTVDDAMEEIVRLRAERDRLRDALERLIERADESDDARYGTMSTTYVRDIAIAALKGEKP